MNLPDFKSHDERDQYFRDHAESFTLIKAGSRQGSYTRDERKTLAEIEQLAQTKLAIGGGRYLVYAIIQEQSAYVKSIS